MVRTLGALLAGLLLAQVGAVRAADAASPAGTWIVTLPFNGASWQVKLESKDGKWTGTAEAGDRRTPEATVEDVSVADGALKLTLKLPKAELSIPFEGALPKEGDKILGTVSLQGKVFPAQFQKTTLISQTGDAQGVRTALELIGQAADKKAKPEEVRSWAEKAVKWADAYGPRWQREITIEVAENLADQDGYGPIALEYAQKAEHSLDPKKDSPAVQRRVLKALAAALDKSDKKDEAKEVETRLEKIPVVVAPPYPGRKGKSDRVALVELFTGAQCPPCVTADLAFDALGKTYKPSEVILLEYHLNIPGPDPMANPDTEERAKYYGKYIEGTPTMFVNGKVGPPPGGRGEDAAQEKYDVYSDLINPSLEKPAKARLKAEAKADGAKIKVRVEVSDLAEPGDDMKLRLALVEPVVAYTGGNRVSMHHHVVRGFVGDGGQAGMVLKMKSGREVADVDPAAVKKGLAEYLKAAVAANGPFFGKEPAVDLKNLRLVAFVQNDETGEVLQAVEVDLPKE